MTADFGEVGLGSTSTFGGKLVGRKSRLPACLALFAYSGFGRARECMDSAFEHFCMVNKLSLEVLVLVIGALGKGS